MSLPLTFASFITNPGLKTWIINIFSYNQPIGFVVYLLLIYLFSFFYSFIQVSPEKVSENLRKQGSYIPGVRPGKETENYISGVLMRTTVVGATYLTIIAILPILFSVFTPLPASVQIGGTSLLIVVGVAQETFKQLETKTKQKKYSGFIK
jgi:preprotein translocase subunit SecY